jgi:D-inositol-3-phosphate glycosyltransferase
MTIAPLKIAMVSEHASPLAVLGGEDAGGQNVHVAALAMALADRGHSVEVFTRRDAPGLPDVVTLHPGVEVVHVPAGPARSIGKDSLPPYMPAFGSWLARRWRRSPHRRPDVVHAHFWMSGTAAVRARASTGIPVVQTFHALGVVKRRHQGAADTSPPERLAREEHLARTAEAVIATCSDEVGELLALGASPERLHIAPCGVDLEAFRPGPRVLTLHRPLRRILSIGRLVERKGVHTLVEALPLVPGAELVVAGGPDERELDADPHVRLLRAAAAEHGVADRVRFVGRVGRADVPALLRSADVVACVPWYEPFGIVPLEAMACGVPVVGSAVGGLLDSVADGRTGLLVPPRDPAATAAALNRVLGDEEYRLRLGREAAAHVAERFGWARVAELTEGVYARLAEPARAGASTAPSTATTADRGAAAADRAVELAVERALA